MHKLFALLNLSHAYVTSLGRLVGVVALTEVRWFAVFIQPWLVYLYIKHLTTVVGLSLYKHLTNAKYFDFLHSSKSAIFFQFAPHLRSNSAMYTTLVT